MARPKFNGVLDLDNRDLKRRFWSWVGTLSGYYEVRIEPRRLTRSQRQNAWYRGFIVAPFFEFLTDQDEEITDPDQAHRILSREFLTVPVVNKRTGEVITTRVRSTTELSIEEMHDYCERCRAWLAKMFDIPTIDPEPDPAKQVPRERNAHRARVPA